METLEYIEKNKKKRNKMDDPTVDGKLSLTESAGNSGTQFHNYIQNHKNNRFAKFDFGKKKNILK